MTRVASRVRLLSTRLFLGMDGFSSSRAFGWLFFLVVGICVCASCDSTSPRRARVELSSVACDVDDSEMAQPLFDPPETIVDAFDVWDESMPLRRARVLRDSSQNGVSLIKTSASSAKRYSPERRGLAFDLWSRCVASCDGRVCRYLVLRVLRN